MNHIQNLGPPKTSLYAVASNSNSRHVNIAYVRQPATKTFFCRFSPWEASPSVTNSSSYPEFAYYAFMKLADIPIKRTQQRKLMTGYTASRSGNVSKGLHSFCLSIYRKLPGRPHFAINYENDTSSTKYVYMPSVTW